MSKHIDTRILVDVTNTAVPTLEIKPMLPEIAKETHHFFDINFIGLALYNGSGEKCNASFLKHDYAL